MGLGLLRRAALAYAAVISLAASLAHAQSPVLYFSAIPDEDETKLTERFTKVAGYLSETLSVSVKYIPLKSYPAAVTAFKNDQIQLAWFGGLTGVQARLAVPGSQAIAQGAEDVSFISYFIANAKTGIAPSDTLPKAVEGRTLTFGSKSSTSGRLMPEYYIRKNLGKAPDEAFSRVGFSGDHTKTVELVQSGAYEIGAVNFTVFDKMVKSGAADPAKVRIIWKTPPYPDYNWTIRGDVNERFGDGFLAKTRDVLLNMKAAALLASFPRKSFIPAKNADYAPIEDTAKELGLID